MTITADLPPDLADARLLVRVEGRPWRVLGPAAGPVEVPDGSLLRLDLPGSAIKAAESWEASLREAVTEIRILPGTADAAVLPSLASFPGLASLFLGGAPLDPDVIPALPELPRLAHLDLSRHAIVRQELEALARQSGLQSLALDGAFLKARDLAALRGLSQLRCLSLLEAEVDGPWLQAIAPLTELREIRFPLAIRGQELRRLSAFPRLEVLWLRDTLIAPPPDVPFRKLVPALRFLALPPEQGPETAYCLDGLPRLNHLLFESSQLGADATGTLAGLPELQTLVLGALPDGAAIESLRRAARLERLQLAPAPLNPDRFLPLAGIATLRSLQIGSPLLDDQSVGTLREFSSLRHLHISESALTPTGLRNLRILLPEVHVTHARHWTPVPELLRGAELYARPPGRYDAEAWQRLPLTPKGLAADAFDELSYRQTGGDAKTLRALQGPLGAQVVEVQLRAVRIEPEDALLLSALTGLQTLDLTSCALPEGFLPALARLPALRKLVLDFTAFGDAQAPVLTRLPALEELSVRATRLTAAGLEVLARRPATLARVDVQGCPIEPGQAKALREGCPRIAWSGTP